MTKEITSNDIREDEMFLSEKGRKCFAEIRHGVWVMYSREKELILPVRPGRILTYTSKKDALEQFFCQSKVPPREELTVQRHDNGLYYCALPVGLCRKPIPCVFYIERVGPKNFLEIQKMALNTLLQNGNYRIF